MHEHSQTEIYLEIQASENGEATWLKSWGSITIHPKCQTVQLGQIAKLELQNGHVYNGHKVPTNQCYGLRYTRWEPTINTAAAMSSILKLTRGSSLSRASQEEKNLRILWSPRSGRRRSSIQECRLRASSGTDLPYLSLVSIAGKKWSLCCRFS
jgi:hypothetical protein